MALEREHSAPTMEERAEYRVAHYRRAALWRGRDWQCRCDAVRPHAEPWQCLTPEQVTAYWITKPTTTYRVVRQMAWLALDFKRARPTT